MISADARHHFFNEGFVEPRLHTFFGQAALIHEQVKQFVHFGVGEAEFAFVGLACPQVSGGRLVHDRRGDVHRLRELADLRLVQIADGIDGAGHVAPQCGVAQQDFGFIARANRQSLEGFRPIIKHDHARPRQDVSLADFRHLRIAADERLDHVGNLNRLTLDLELVNQQLGVFQRIAAGGLVRHADGEHVLRPQRFRGQRAREGGIQSAGKPDDRARETGAGDLGFDESRQDLAREGGVDGEVKAIHSAPISFAKRNARFSRDLTPTSHHPSLP